MLIFQFKGGLGNQLFQYAYYRTLVHNNVDVIPDLSFYFNGNRDFSLNIFSIADSIRTIDYKNKIYILKCGLFRKICKIKGSYYQENMDCEYDKKVFEIKNGFLTGYFQNIQYFESIADIIRREIVFPPGEAKLVETAKMIKSGNYTSIHIRRMDFVKYADIYGDICTHNYYKRAIQEVLMKEPDTIFIVFSDDLEWAKVNIKVSNVIYITSSDFDAYKDWYDMFLMSCCKNNIIANSTFSWWGAWLNDNPGKKVICPSRWDNLFPDRGIACPGWIIV